jgi:hypothetical protein
MRTGFGRLQSVTVVVARPPLKKFLRSRRYDGRWKAAGSMSEWRDEINRKALARLDKALPEVFPPPVLTHAMGADSRRRCPGLQLIPIGGRIQCGPISSPAHSRRRAAGQRDGHGALPTGSRIASNGAAAKRTMRNRIG